MPCRRVEAGYRLIDTARELRQRGRRRPGHRATAGIAREDLFVTTKLNAHQGTTRALRGLRRLAGQLGLDYVDLYLIHWPNPEQDRYVDDLAGPSPQLLRRAARARSASPTSSLRTSSGCWTETGVAARRSTRSSCTPHLPQQELRAFHAEHGIVTAVLEPARPGRGSCSPTRCRRDRRAHGRTPAQVVLRWHLQPGDPRRPEVGRPAAASRRTSPSSTSSSTRPTWPPSPASTAACAPAPTPTSTWRCSARKRLGSCPDSRHTGAADADHHGQRPPRLPRSTEVLGEPSG